MEIVHGLSGKTLSMLLNIVVTALCEKVSK
jgi:hypothetical protein